jgi:hypothetical protein
LLKNFESESKKSVEMGELLGNRDPPRTLRELFAPIITNTPSCIVLSATNATHFDLKLNVIRILPTFNGLENEDPYAHVRDFWRGAFTTRNRAYPSAQNALGKTE